MIRDLANAIASTTPAVVEGNYERHSSLRRAGLSGSTGGGRWGPPQAFSVLYFGAPRASVIVEAYRALVDGVEGMTGADVAARRLLTVKLRITDLLDLRVAEHLEAVGLTPEALSGPWEVCQPVAAAAHQLGMHGIVVPAATGMGTTLALFERHLPPEQFPEVISEETWTQLPPDPRRASKADATSHVSGEIRAQHEKQPDQ